MNSLVNYLLESGISLSALSLIYLVFLRRETFFRTNRIFLLFSVVFSLLLPLLHIPVFAPQSNMIAEVEVSPYQNLLETVIVSSQGFSESVETAVASSLLIVWGYLTGLILFLSLFLFRSLQLWRLIRQSEIIEAGSYKLALVNSPISPFSFLKYIFISRNFREIPGHERMLLHETEHVKQGHTYDVLILEILTIFQWFNPFMWLLRRAIRENHEYLADKAVLSAGVRPADYKELLLGQFIGGPYFATSHFNYSLIRNRIRMMTRMESPRIALAKISPGLLLGAALVVIFACEQKNSLETVMQLPATTSEKSLNASGNSISAYFKGDTLTLNASPADLKKIEELLGSERLITVKEVNGSQMDIVKSGNKQIARETSIPQKHVSEEQGRDSSSPSAKSNPSTPQKTGSEEQVFFIVEEMPEFPGGEQALRNHIATSVKYPALAQQNGTQGRVYVQFVVSKDGSVKNATVVRGVDPLLDREALRVVNSLPAWIPGKQRGKAVNVSYTVPISFVLN